MTVRATSVNPTLLRWARERSGYERAEVAKRMKQSDETLAAWEAGNEFPTFRQLEVLAETVYKRPIALFFFPEPPVESDEGTQFRTLPTDELEKLLPDTRLAIREAVSLQESVRELVGDRNGSERPLLREIQPRVSETAAELATRVRSYLQMPLDEQFALASTESAFKYWRQKIQGAGVFVFKRAFKQSEISGFCLHDAKYPLIMVNNSTAHARQSFTLFHELGHLLFGIGGITTDDVRYIRHMKKTDQRVEMVCNEFAASVLVPAQSFPWHEFRGGDVERTVASVARRYAVSRDVVLRRLLDRDLVTASKYEQLVIKWNREFRQARESREGGGNYYATKATYLGETYLGLAFRRYVEGNLSQQDLADHLGMKARNVLRLEDFVLGMK